MRCRDCGGEFGMFDAMVPVWQMRLDQQGIEQSGYVHMWHLTNPDLEQ